MAAIDFDSRTGVNIPLPVEIVKEFRGVMRRVKPSASAFFGLAMNEVR